MSDDVVYLDMGWGVFHILADGTPGAGHRTRCGRNLTGWTTNTLDPRRGLCKTCARRTERHASTE